MTLGVAKRVRKVADGDPPVVVQPKTWTRLMRFELSDAAVGWSILDGEVYCDFPKDAADKPILPLDIRTRWVRAGGDVTKRTGLVIGKLADFGAIVPAALEYLSADDFPLDLQLRHDHPSALSFHTVIAAIYNASAYAAGRLLVGEE